MDFLIKSCNYAPPLAKLDTNSIVNAFEDALINASSFICYHFLF